MDTCKAEGCSKEIEAKGYCVRHYRLWRKGKMPKPRYRICNAENCRKPQVRRGLCPEHFAKEYTKVKAEPAAEAPAPTPAAS